MIDNKIIKVDVYKLSAFSYERKNDRSFRKCTDLVSPIICEGSLFKNNNVLLC